MSVTLLLRVRRWALLAGAASCLALQGAPLSAQEAETAAPEPTLKESKEILRLRNRGNMHPGDPLVISGLEQGDNDIRSHTPILQQTDKVPLLVDQEENYRRTLAMYESRTLFTRPLTPIRYDGQAPALLTPLKRAAPTSSAVADSSPQWPWLVGLVVAMAATLLVRKRFGATTPSQRTS